MAESFKCPSCSAPLEFAGTPVQKCNFCGSSVIAPTGVLRDSPRFGSVGQLDFGDLSALTGKALKIAEIRKLIHEGQKIQAIKVFRETFGSDLVTAKNAVEAIERGESVDISGMRVQATGGPAQIKVGPDAVKKIALGVGGSFLGIFLLTALIIVGVIVFVFWMVSRTVDRALSTVPSISTQSKSPETPVKSIAEQRLSFGGEGTGAGKFNDNRTIAVAADGRIFSADYSGGRIQAFDAEGKFLIQINADTSKSVDALAVDRKGTLWVLQGYDVNRYNSANGEKLGVTRVDSATDLAPTLDGKVYVCSRYGEIAVLGDDGAKVRSIKLGKDLGIEMIHSIAVDGQGNMFLLEGRNFAIFKLGPDGKLITRFAGRPEKLGGKAPNGQFTSRPMDMTVDSQGRLYVVETEKISIFDRNGTFIDSFETRQAFGIVIADNDEVFIASRPNVVSYKVSL